MQVKLRISNIFDTLMRTVSKLQPQSQFSQDIVEKHKYKQNALICKSF